LRRAIETCTVGPVAGGLGSPFRGSTATKTPMLPAFTACILQVIVTEPPAGIAGR
jgi:hypothetical protein